MDTLQNTIGALAARRMPENGLFERAIRGDAIAFAEVYRRYEKRVLGFCMARSLDREAAADATQEVFMRLLKAEPGSLEHPGAWLFAVARNVTIDVIRKRTRLAETEQVDEDSAAWESMAAADTADEVANRADARAVFLALRRMRPRYRTALILREIHGQSSADIAESMGVKSVGAVDTLVSRARDAFGVAYAATSDLPPSCRDTVELTYRSRGSGITSREQERLAAHLESCQRCRNEDARADDPKRLPSLLPLLVPAGEAAHSLLGQAAIVARPLPSPTFVQAVSQTVQTHLHTVGARVAAGVLVATLVTAPVVAVTSAHARVPAGSVRTAASPAVAVPVAPSPMAGGTGSRSRVSAAMSAASPSASHMTGAASGSGAALSENTATGNSGHAGMSGGRTASSGAGSRMSPAPGSSTGSSGQGQPATGMHAAGAAPGGMAIPSGM